MAAATILAPLDIHGLTVVPFDFHGLPGEGVDFLIRQREFVAILVVHLNGCDTVVTAVGINHLDSLATKIPPDNGMVATGQTRLVDVELVRVDGALDDCFPQSIA